MVDIDDEIIKIDPKADEDALVRKFEADTRKTLYPAQSERIMINIIAYMSNVVLLRIKEAFKLFFVRFSTIFFLRLWGEMIGTTQLEAKAATDIIEVKLYEEFKSDRLIPKGTKVETKDGEYIFLTDEDLIIKAGQLTGLVGITSELAGSVLNQYGKGEVNNLCENYEYIESVKNINGVSGGADEEEIERYRARLLLAPEKFSTAGPACAYEYFALSAHQDIVDVKAESPSPGVVRVYILTKEGAANTSIIEKVESILNADHIRPLTDKVEVRSADKIDLNINPIVTFTKTADYETVVKAVNLAIESFFKKIREKLYQSYVPSQLIAVINSIEGVYSVELEDLTIKPGFIHSFYNTNINQIVFERAE